MSITIEISPILEINFINLAISSSEFYLLLLEWDFFGGLKWYLKLVTFFLGVSLKFSYIICMYHKIRCIDYALIYFLSLIINYNGAFLPLPIYLLPNTFKKINVKLGKDLKKNLQKLTKKTISSEALSLQLMSNGAPTYSIPSVFFALCLFPKA